MGSLMALADATTRLTASDFPQEVLNLFDQYVHGLIDRRAFVDGASRFTVAGGMTAAAMLEALRPNYALARQVAPDDARIRTDYVTVPSPQGNGSIRGLMAWPDNATGPFGSVLVIHENRGLNPYIEDVVRRFAVAGFLALGPDGLTSVGGYPGDDERGGQLFGQVDRPKMTEDFVAAANFLRTHADSNGRLGAVGFCFGGGMVNTLAVRLGANLAAGAPFYGGQPPVEQVANIRAPIMAHYASADERINAGIPAFEAALKAAGRPHTIYIYENTQHGFHNDTTPRYAEAAAKLAQERTIAFFKQHLTT
jgi:carboxymethylenebutenolidase